MERASPKRPRCQLVAVCCAPAAGIQSADAMQGEYSMNARLMAVDRWAPANE